MSIVYESRLALSDFSREFKSGKGVETLSDYLKCELKGSLLVKTLRLNSKKNGDIWFTLRYGRDRKCCEIPIGVQDLTKKDILDRVSYELGWIDPKDWDSTQVSWRLDSLDDQQALSVGTQFVVASRKAQERLFSVTSGSVDFTWVPLDALFPDLPYEAKFVGWKKASKDATKLELEKVDEKYMFEKFFPSIYRDYVRTLLHLPIAVGDKIIKTVDFRRAQAEAFEPLLLQSGTKTPDAMFHAMIVFRVPIGVSKNGRLLAFPRLPNRPARVRFLKLKKSRITEGADIVPVENTIKEPNWYVSFPVVPKGECIRLNMATLDVFDPVVRCHFLQKYIFPFSPSNLPISAINKCFTWRMKWAYTFSKPFTVAKKSEGDFDSSVFVSLLQPWY